MIDAAAMLRYPLLICTYRTLLGLLAVSGLRVGEAIRLDTSDIDWKRGLLIVRNTKFGKADVHARLSVLSTYLGHVNPSNTYWYLSAAPELLALAGERLQRHLDQLGDRT